MDIISHALWGATIVRNKEALPLVIGGSLLPDVGCLPDVFVVLRSYYQDYRKGVKRNFRELLTGWREIPSREAVFGVYYFFHSFFTWLIVTLILFWLARDYLVVSFAIFFILLLIYLLTERQGLFSPFPGFALKASIFWTTGEFLLLMFFFWLLSISSLLDFSPPLCYRVIRKLSVFPH